jgi:PAS domain S-box-containing protein
MDPMIIFTSPYTEMTSTIQSVSEELELPVTIVEDTMTDAAEKVKKLVSRGNYEVIVSRAGTAEEIEQVVDLPIVHCDNSDFDIMQAFIRAKKLGDKIGFLTYPEEAFPYKMKTVKEVIDFEVIQFRYRISDELNMQIERAAQMGIEVLVGGGTRALKKMEHFGMKGMHIITSKRAIRRALIRANEVVQYRIAAREKAERLNALIQASEEGIFFITKDKRIETFNPAAEKMFGIQAESVIGRDVKSVVHPKLRKLLTSNLISGEAGQVTMEDMVVMQQPIKIGKGYVGTVVICREISKIQQLESDIRRELHTKGLVAKSSFSDIQLSSKTMQEVLRRAKYFAATDSTILITGESGTGKELIAQGIHNESERKNGPFVAVNCAALPESLLESELFGYADGAFTGAKKGGRHGLFELAHGGTIFLDEVGEISGPIQSRLLRVLQEKEVMRVGGDRVIPVDIRVIAATNRNLWDSVKEGQFRSDLYFRINVLRIMVPSLRERREDIPGLVQHFLNQGGVETCWDGLTSKMRNFFLEYHWPGNVRELENIVERYRLIVRSRKDEAGFIDEVFQETDSNVVPLNNEDEEMLQVQIGPMEEIEKQIFDHMMERYNHNRTMVADKLGISRTTLWKKLST